MKYLVVLACLLVATYAAIPPEAMEKIKKEFHKFAGECKDEVGASEDDVKPMLNHEPPTTEKGKCFVACMNKKWGFQDKSGKVDKDGTMNVIEKFKPLDGELYDKMKKVTETCLGEVGDAANECETAANMYVCVKREKAANGIENMDLQS